ncbi:condensation domain-containing protein [Lentzea sp. NPDC004782]|uniref:condensation domain-containing protein n=1 Tax=Lentzea sp. NPDC004782 TaxID=3154458 RepID=UPI00339FAA29
MPDHKVLPLSFAQQQFWLADQLDPGNPSYNCAGYLDLSGPIDAELLRAAATRTLEDNDVARVRFMERDGVIRQLVGDLGAAAVSLVDLSAERDSTSAAHTRMTAVAKQAIDLHAGPPVTCHVLRVADDRVLLSLCAHHIVVDGYGFVLVLRRMAEVYTALTEERPVPAVGHGQLADVVAEDAAYRASPAWQAHREFWTARAADHPPVRTLAAGWAPVAHCSVRSALEVPPAAVDGLRAVARTGRCGFSGVLIAAAARYTQQATGERDVVLGLAVTGRQGRVVRDVPGLMANVVPLRVRTDPAVPLAECAAEVAREARAALAHQRYDGLFADLQQHRVFGPVVNVLPWSRPLLFGQVAAVPEYLSTGPQDDICLTFSPQPPGGGIRLIVEANPTTYDADAVNEHLHGLAALLTPPSCSD